MLKGFLLAAPLLVLFAMPVKATPTLSGDYALNVTVTCQATPSFPSGEIYTKLMDANYTPSGGDPLSGTVSVTGQEIYGPLIASSDVGVTVATLSPYSGAYSNTDTTLAATGVTWNIQYAAIGTGGIAKSYFTSGTYTISGVGPICNGWGIGVHK